MRPFNLALRSARSAARPAAALRFSRAYSIKATAASDSKLHRLDATKLSVERTGKPKALLPPDELVFGKTFTGTATPRLSTTASYSLTTP
jgi:branched-chain amino acid aminotransferase